MAENQQDTHHQNVMLIAAEKGNWSPNTINNYN